MRVGIHLPQYGRAAGAEAIRRAALQAEDLGLDDVWVSDHQVVPADVSYPPAFLFEPLMTLAWAGAVTRRVGLGTSVLVLPQHAPVALANALASLDQLSGGRLILGAGIGWLVGEFAALGASFADRGPRMDEILGLLRACWEQDPIEFRGRFHRVEGVRLLPKPARRIPIWLGGRSEPAYRRAVAHGDGFQLLRTTPEEARAAVARLRRDRPGSDFAISLRVDWDGLRDDPEKLRRELDAYRDAGVQHVLCVPAQSKLDAWLESAERLATVFAHIR
jgi:probable F420-dependent oxidoreductase